MGFAAETTDLQANARLKLEEKQLDAIVANDVSEPGIGFASGDNAVRILTADGREIGVPKMAKDRVADRVLGVVAKLRSGTQRQVWEPPRGGGANFWEDS